MSNQVVANLLQKLVAKLPPPRVIFDRDGGTPYLSRWYLTGDPPAVDSLGNPIGRPGEDPDRPYQIYLHRFHRSDHDGELHSHPWQWSVAIVLAGGYMEERRVGDHVKLARRGPFSVNVIRSDDYHRVDLLNGDSWSLFIAGPKADSWYFWCRNRVAKVGWRSFLAWKQYGAMEPIWQPDSRKAGSK